VKPAPFHYFDPATCAETVALLAEYGDEGKILAGGQSLLPMLNFRLARPECLIDINRVTELDYVRAQDGVLAIGAMTRHRTLERSDVATGAWSLLRETLSNVGHAHIRNRGTIGGSLAHADPAAELPAAVSALGGSLVVRGGSGTREVATEDFFGGYFTTSLEPTELVVEVRIPQWPTRTGSCFEEVSRRRGDFAQLGVAAVVALDEQGRVLKVGLCLAGASSVPVQARSVIDGLQGELPDDGLIGQLADEFAGTLRPPSDNHGTAEYRKQLARYLVPRALETAIARAQTA
jgi:carbon-monoxide dehydrogenase medium subunit